MEAGRRLDNRAAVEVDTSGAKIGPVLRRSVDTSGQSSPATGMCDSPPCPRTRLTRERLPSVVRRFELFELRLDRD